MVGTISYEIEVHSKDYVAIKELMDVLEACPIDLSNDDYVDILREMANHSNDLENPNIVIKYIREEG